MMEPVKKHGDPLEDEIHEQPARGADEVKDNQPGSKGRRDEEDQPIVRSVSQKPNQPDGDATMAPGGDLGKRRTNL